MAQSGHAISQFFIDHSEIANQWNNNYLISLSIENEYNLKILLKKLKHLNVMVSSFHEPDINDELTSIAFIGTDETQKLTSSLPLSLKELKSKIQTI